METRVAIGIGIIGSGGMGLTWAEVVARSGGAARVAAIWGGSRSAALAAQYGATEERSLHDLLARPDVDAVVIASPLATHGEYVVAAARAGRHVFLEKPMSVSIDEADAMIAAAEAADVRLAVVTQHRFREAPVAARRAIEEGAIGPVQMAHARGMLFWPEPAAGHVPWAELGYHVCDVLRWLVGSAVVDVTARFADPGRRVEGPPLPSRTVMATFRFASGALASLWLSYAVPPPGLASQMQFQVVGTTGIIDLDSYAEARLGTASGWRVIARQPDGDPADPLDPVRIATYQPQFSDFLDAIRDRRPPVVDGHEARRTMQMLLAAITANDLPGVSPDDVPEDVRLR